MLSKDSLLLFEDLLNSVQLPANHPEFETKALMVIQAKREIAEGLSQSSESPLKIVPDEVIEP